MTNIFCIGQRIESDEPKTGHIKEKSGIDNKISPMMGNKGPNIEESKIMKIKMKNTIIFLWSGFRNCFSVILSLQWKEL